MDNLQNFPNDPHLINKAPVYKFFPSKVTITVAPALGFQLQQTPLWNELQAFVKTNNAFESKNDSSLIVNPSESESPQTVYKSLTKNFRKEFDAF